MPWVAEETLAPVRRQDSTDHDVGLRTSKSPSPSESPNSRILRGYCGVKGSGDPDPYDIKSKAQPRSKKCPRTNGENPGLQIVPLKTVVSSTGHNHGREKCHVTQGSPPKDPEGDSRPYRLAIGGR